MKIATLTISLALDKSTTIDRLQPEKKLLFEAPTYEPDYFLCHEPMKG